MLYVCQSELYEGFILYNLEMKYYVIATHVLSLAAAPYWTNAPVSQLYAPGETVKLDCQADGTPTPVVRWSKNGIPLSGWRTDPACTHKWYHTPLNAAFMLTLCDFWVGCGGVELDKDPRRNLTESRSLILKDVNFADTAVYQCEASNVHGTILINTNVYVIGKCLFRTCGSLNANSYVYLSCGSFLLVRGVVSELPAQILSEDGTTYTFLEGQKASLECETFGSPKPKVTW